MFNKAERARREAARDRHKRSYDAMLRNIPDGLLSLPGELDKLNATACFHRKQAELWEKHVKAFDMAALRTAKLVGRK